MGLGRDELGGKRMGKRGEAGDGLRGKGELGRGRGLGGDGFGSQGRGAVGASVRGGAHGKGRGGCREGGYLARSVLRDRTHSIQRHILLVCARPFAMILPVRPEFGRNGPGLRRIRPRKLLSVAGICSDLVGFGRISGNRPKVGGNWSKCGVAFKPLVIEIGVGQSRSTRRGGGRGGSRRRAAWGACVWCPTPMNAVPCCTNAAL